VRAWPPRGISRYTQRLRRRSASSVHRDLQVSQTPLDHRSMSAGGFAGDGASMFAMISACRPETGGNGRNSVFVRPLQDRVELPELRLKSAVCWLLAELIFTPLLQMPHQLGGCGRYPVVMDVPARLDPNIIP